MNVFGVGGWELILIAVIAILILGPERMARYAFQAGRWMRRLSGIWQESMGALREQLNAELDIDVTKEDLELLRSLKDLNLEERLGLKDIARDLAGNGGRGAPRSTRYGAWAASKGTPTAPEPSEPLPKADSTTEKTYPAWTPPRKPS